MAKATKETRTVDASQTAIQLDESVRLQLLGGANLLVGEWLMAAWIDVEMAAYRNEVSIPDTEVSKVADRIAQVFGDAHKAGHAPVDYDVVKAARLSGAQVRRLRIAGEYLAGLVLTDTFDGIQVPDVQRPATVVQHAYTTKAIDSLRNNPAAFLATYAATVETARQNAATARKERAEAKKAAKKAAKTEPANTDSAGKSELPVANPLMDALNKRINEAAEAHGLKAVHDAVMAALETLAAPVETEPAKKPTTRKARKATAATPA